MSAKDRDQDVTIRPAEPGDLDAMIAITGESFGPFAVDAHIERMLGRAGEASWLDLKAASLRRELSARPDVCFVAEVGGRVVGYITNVITESASRGTIANLAVSPACRGRGVGRKLLLTSLDCFRRLGLKQAKIETLTCNEVCRRLYPSVGFREVIGQIHYAMPLD